MIKIWVDDERPMPEGYGYHVRSTFEAIQGITFLFEPVESDVFEGVLLDCDHDAGSEARWGGDFIKILQFYARPEFESYFKAYMESKGEKPFKVRFHSANPVGVKNMRAIVKNCPWMEEV